MKEKWWMLIAGVLFGLLSAGLILLVSQPPRGKSVILRPPPTRAPVVIDIDGAVAQPGVYSLPVNSRVRDAVQAAGGFTANANADLINAAALLEDGDHIHVPAKGEDPLPVEGGKENVHIRPTPTQVDFPININIADQATLEALPGIGPVTAEKIIACRQEEKFSTIEEIQRVPGIGPATFENIKHLIIVGE